MESPPSASWRSGRTAALPYPPLLAYLRYHMSIMGFKSFAKIFQFKFRFMFFKVNSAPKPEFTLQIEEFLEIIKFLLTSSEVCGYRQVFRDRNGTEKIKEMLTEQGG